MALFFARLVVWAFNRKVGLRMNKIAGRKDMGEKSSSGTTGTHKKELSESTKRIRGRCFYVPVRACSGGKVDGSCT